MNTPPKFLIRRLDDGSIDTAFYLARGRSARSRQAHRLFGGMVPAIRRALARWVSWGTGWPYSGLRSR